MKKYLVILLAMTTILFLAQTQAFASHLKVTNALISEVNTLTKTAKVQFEVSWDNAWKNDTNCDAVYVFAKFKDASGLWKHVDLNAASASEFNYTDQTPEKFSKGSFADLGMWVANEKKGAFLFRTKDAGSVAAKNIQLVWDYAKAGVSDEQIFNTQVKVFGLEMVYIPQDEHYVGDPAGPDGPDNCLYAYPNNGAYLIKSEDPVIVDKVEGALYCDQDNPRSREDTPFTIPATFPKGYRAFWMMKYELTSQQFVDFLNSLTRKQQQSRVAADITNDEILNYYVLTNTNTEKMRNAVVCLIKGNGTTQPVTFYTYAPSRGLNFMSWSDVAAYADWAGLRPITELEYEKAARGPLAAVADECAWGTTDIGRAHTFNGADGSGYEIKVPTKGIVNASYGSGIAPFEAAAGKTVSDNPGYEGPVTGELFENTQHEGISKRINDGASYYGVMNLSGNLWERCVTIGHKFGRAFNAIHGDGALDEEGFANVINWPGKDGTGAGNRGGVWSSPSMKYLRMALRFAAHFPKAEDGKHSGCRVGF